MILMVVACVASISLVIWKAVENRRPWREFAAEHHCKVVAKVSGDVDIGTGVGVMPDGKLGVVTTTTTTPGKTGWQCDDGVTYWR